MLEGRIREILKSGWLYGHVEIDLGQVQVNVNDDKLHGHKDTWKNTISISILSFLPMVAPQSRTDLQGAMIHEQQLPKL